jgi:hypothetical protein
VRVVSCGAEIDVRGVERVRCWMVGHDILSVHLDLVLPGADSSPLILRRR